LSPDRYLSIRFHPAGVKNSVSALTQPGSDPSNTRGFRLSNPFVCFWCFHNGGGVVVFKCEAEARGFDVLSVGWATSFSVVFEGDGAARPFVRTETFATVAEDPVAARFMFNLCLERFFRNPVECLKAPHEVADHEGAAFRFSKKYSRTRAFFTLNGSDCIMDVPRLQST
jgi:hypothetical protein